MAKPSTSSQNPKPTSKTLNNLLPITSPIKNPRTTKTKPRNLIQPVALRKLVGNKIKSHTGMLDNLAPYAITPPPNQVPQPTPCSSPAQQLTPTINPTQPPSQDTSQPHRPTKAQKAMATAFQLRKSPRRHSTPIVTGKSATSKPPPPPPTQPNYSTACTSTDGDMNMGGRMSQNNPMRLVDEDVITSDGTQAIQDSSDDLVRGWDALTSDAVDGDNVCDDDNSSSHEIDECEREQREEVAEGEDVAEGENDDEMEEMDEDAEVFPIPTSVPKKRKTRGPTRCLRLVGVKGKARPRVVLNMYNQPIGPEPHIQSLSPSIGILAKTPNVISLEYQNWRKVPPKVKDTVWEMINNTFKIPLEGKPWVLKSAGDSWRLFKSQLKAKHFREHLDEKEMMRRRPKKLVPEDQWKALVKYWFDPKTIEMSRRNCISVQHRKNVHTAGSRSFARIAAAEAKDGKDPSLAAVYIKTRTNKEKTREELLNLGQDDAQVEEYLVANNLLKKRPGSVLLKGRGVTKSSVRKAKYEEEANKKAEAKIDLVRAECYNNMEALKDQMTTIIQNLVTKLQSTNLQQEFASFNPFEGCPDFDFGSDDSYAPDDDYSDDASDISLVSEHFESGEDLEMEVEEEEEEEEEEA